MTIEKLKELLQIRVDYFEQHLTDEAMTAQLKAYTANLAPCRTKSQNRRSGLPLANAGIRNSSLWTGRTLCGRSCGSACL